MLVGSQFGWGEPVEAWGTIEPTSADQAQKVQLTSARDCILRLKELAANDSLPAYEGEAERIINNKLLWQQKNNPYSLGSASLAVKLDLLKLANAWRMGKVIHVRSLLEKIATAL
jgi:hypothetical protein